jgi:hypothetical protein
MGFTDDCYTDGRDPSVTPSVLFLPTDFIAVTDRISPSAKLYNVVVYVFFSFLIFSSQFFFITILYEFFFLFLTSLATTLR